MEWRKCRAGCNFANTSIRISTIFLTSHPQPPPLALSFYSHLHSHAPSSASIVNPLLSSSHFLLPAVGEASHRRVESPSVWRLAALLSLCTTSLHHPNLWLALRRGPLTTHACFHVTPLWIGEITLTLTLRAKTLAGFQHLDNVANSYPAATVFINALSKRMLTVGERVFFFPKCVFRRLNTALLAFYFVLCCVEILNAVKIFSYFLCFQSCLFISFKAVPNMNFGQWQENEVLVFSKAALSHMWYTTEDLCLCQGGFSILEILI